MLLDPTEPLFWLNLFILIFLVEAIPFIPIHLEAVLLMVLLITHPLTLWVVSVIALSLGTATSYGWTYQLANTKWLRKQLERKNVRLLRHYFVRYGDPFLIIIRTIPVIPYRSINIIAGPLKYPFKRYMLLSILTAMFRLGLIIFGTSILIEITGNKLITIIIVILVLLLLSLLSIIYLNHLKKKENNTLANKNSEEKNSNVRLVINNGGKIP